MKYLLILIITIFLSACGGGNNSKPPASNIPAYESDYIITGQSNANRPAWPYFENLTNSKTYKISRGGFNINKLINDFMPFDSTIGKPKGIIFIHGENDAIEKTDPAYYIERVEHYRKMISENIGIDLPLYISTVGYYTWKPELDYSFDAIREAVKNEAVNNPKWIIAYDDARYFRDWGLLIEADGIHFKSEACKLLMDTIANIIVK